MNNIKVRKLGILLGYSRVDRFSTTEIWIYKGRKVSVTVFDPSATEAVRRLSVTAETKRVNYKKFTSDLQSLYEAYTNNEQLRDLGSARKDVLKLTTEGRINKYLVKDNTIKRKAIKRRK